MIVLDESLGEAIYAATKTIATVGPNDHVDNGPEWFKLFSAAIMLAALAFTALLTAGVVNRLLDRRLTAIVGRRCLPRSKHVVVVGLGQVWLRLCLLLRELGAPVLATEVHADADYVARAKDYGIPVVIVRGSSGYVLRSLSLSRARALAPSRPTRSRTSRSWWRHMASARSCARCCARVAVRSSTRRGRC